MGHGPQPEPDQNCVVHEEPVQLDPVQEDPVHDEPVQLEPVHEDPVQLEPVHEEPVQLEPVHEQPVHEEPVHEEPVHEEPIQSPPVHELPEALIGAHWAVSKALPKMSCSPLSSTPLSVRRWVPRDVSSEPRPVAASHVWAAMEAEGVAKLMARAMLTKPWPLETLVSEGIGAAEPRRMYLT